MIPHIRCEAYLLACIYEKDKVFVTNFCMDNGVFAVQTMKQMSLWFSFQSLLASYCFFMFFMRHYRN